MKARYTLGVDFGTNSVRAVVVNCTDGSTAGSCVVEYPSGDQGILLDPRDHNLARQHPADYHAGLEASIQGALADTSHTGEVALEHVIGIGVDTTGSTPLPVDKEGAPLAMGEAFRGHLAAQAWLWKDHTAAEEAQQITRLALEHRPQYLAKCGDTYSSEWFWSKVWKCLKVAPEIFDAAHSWVELADYIPALLTGQTAPGSIRRGICAAGHKALYCEEWNGLPDEAFLSRLDPKLAALRARLYVKAHDASAPAGTLCRVWADRLGLRAGIPVAIGALDAHYGAVGAGVAPGTMIKIIGTSTCDCTVGPAGVSLGDVPGICGVVHGSILPGHDGLEAGQSAVGDIFRWFVEGVCEGNEELHSTLTEEAMPLTPGQSGLLALDWNNGNRSVLEDPKLSGLLIGQTLYTTRAEIYRALIEATAFGARAIIERLREYDVGIDRIVCCGGIAEKNPLLMRIYADVTGCTMQMSASNQTCALGSALAAAVAAGARAGGYNTFAEAQANMTGVKAGGFAPEERHRTVYDQLYALYKELHDAFGGIRSDADLGHTMKTLIAIKDRQLRG